MCSHIEFGTPVWKPGLIMKILQQPKPSPSCIAIFFHAIKNTLHILQYATGHSIYYKQDAMESTLRRRGGATD